MRAEVLAVGDELISGARVNSNAAWLGSRLAEVDVEVVRGTVVGDDVDVVAEAIRVAAARVELVVVTGGLGPTSDDRTRDALALVLGGGMHRDADVEAVIRERYAARGRTVAPVTLTQADVPDGATALPNPAGTAPGLRASVGDAVVVCLPGVPAEMRAIVDTALVPDLARASSGRAAVAVIRTALVGETVIASRLEALEVHAAAAGVKVAYLPSAGQVAVRLVVPPSGGVLPGEVGSGGAASGEAASGEAASGQAVLAPLVDELVEALGDLVAVRGPGSLAEEVVRVARASGATIAVAESLTGGAVSAALTDVPGASHALRGGVVAYATDLKASMLDVDPELLARAGAVDADVARAMAEGVRTRLSATHGVATTGVAGPDLQDGHEPGTVHVAVAGPGGTRVLSPVLPGDRERVRALTVTYALELLRRSLLDLPLPPAP